MTAVGLVDREAGRDSPRTTRHGHPHESETRDLTPYWITAIGPKSPRPRAAWELVLDVTMEQSHRFKGATVSPMAGRVQQFRR